LSRSNSTAPEEELRAVPFTSSAGNEGFPSFSPDGNRVAFVWNGEEQANFDVYVKQIGSGTALRLTTDPATDTNPAWSPNDRYIAFLRFVSLGRWQVVLVPPLGGPERDLGEINVPLLGRISIFGPFGGFLAWTPDGASLVLSGRDSAEGPVSLFLHDIETGARRTLTTPPENSFGDVGPAFAADGGSLAFIRVENPARSELYVLALSDELRPAGEPVRIPDGTGVAGTPVWTLDGSEIVFSSGNWSDRSLWRVDASGAGKPRRLAAVGESGSYPALSLRSHPSHLVYQRRRSNMNIWRFEGPPSDDDATGTGARPSKLISSTYSDLNAQYSPNGTRITFASHRTGSPEIWMCDRDGSGPVQLTSLGAPVTGTPRWSPDGKRVVFDSSAEGQFDIYVVNVAGGSPTRLTDNESDDVVPSCSRDGKWVYFTSSRTGREEVWKLPIEGGEPVQVSKGGGTVAFESPDGESVYFLKGPDLWRMPAAGGEEERVVGPVYHRGYAVVGRGIYFVAEMDASGRRSIRFLSFATGETAIVATTDRPLGLGLTASPDGRSILYSQRDDEGTDLMLVENFR
jgi:Tol biopolymer transport system component